MVSLGITWFCSPWRLQNAPWAGASVGVLAVVLLLKTGAGRAALTWLRVSLLPQERLGLNGSFMGQWEASLLAGIPHTPPCPVWGPCCLAPFIVYPQLASSGMWLLTVPPQVPATLDKAGSSNSCSFFMPSLRRCCCFPSEAPHHFAKISPETGLLALLCIDAFSFLWGHGSHPAVASSQLVPHTYRPGTKLTGDLVYSF